jgi:L,D-peptidoglycan transpeptidase YkuD (ErfK/YbiS/YcfS/YnhG family)/cell wall-associated NlpC family hydrolase
MKSIRLLSLLLALLGATCHARDARTSAESVLRTLGVTEARLTPEYWIAKLDEPDRVVLDRAAIAAQNAKLREFDPSMHDLGALPETLGREQVRAWIEDLADAPSRVLYDETGDALAPMAVDRIVRNRDLDAIPATQPTRHGLVVRRSALRTFPTRERVFREPGDTDIDRFQESALFPGTPVVIAHESADREWWFVVSPRYAAWIEQSAVAEGSVAQVAAYVARQPYRIVTGATVHTVFTPEQPALSQLQLDMGVRVPVLAGWPAERLVNGQNPYTAHVIELPLRAHDGTLSFAPALLQKNADSADDYLPLTRANLLRQAFKFLGERYGWGHSRNGRDCSGFVSEVYRSMGVELPRNTRDQASSPALHKRIFDAADDHDARVAAVRALEVGDLVYLPDHVMMAIGRIDGAPWVIHDTTGIDVRAADGTPTRVTLNAVSVTPLLPLQSGAGDSILDRITSIVRIRPVAERAATSGPGMHRPAADGPARDGLSKPAWSAARQLVLVTTPDWDADHGVLRTFARDATGWVETAAAVRVVVGRAGSAWGVGLHPVQPGPRKKEGDGRAPAGLFAIGTAFGYARSADTALPYVAMDRDDWCIDVTGSPFYNRIVDAREVGAAAVAGSSEPMRRDLHAGGDSRYRLGFVIGHNPSNIPGAGSCIFAHLWKSPDTPTAGCTAMAARAMRRLLAWLRPEDHPVFALLPQAEYERLGAQWGLPSLSSNTIH